MERLKRLKDLVDQLERLPASPDRDRVLAEVRSRAVDVDTGVTPARCSRCESPRRRRRHARRARSGTPARDHAHAVTRPSGPAGAPAAPAVVADDLGVLPWDHRLSLEDSPELAPLPRAPRKSDGSVPPWALGLRG